MCYKLKQLNVYYCFLWFKKQEFLTRRGTLYNGLYWEAQPERSTFFTLQAYEVHERVGNLSFRYLKEPFKIFHIGKQVNPRMVSLATSANPNTPKLINREAYTIRKISPNVKSKPVYTTEKLDRPFKKGVRNWHTCSCKLHVLCFLRWVRTRILGGLGA